MKKKFLCIALVFAMMGAMLTTAALAYGEEYQNYSPNVEQQYSDVPHTHWAFQSIESCSQRNWFNGYADGTFHPTDLIRRDEAAKVFVEALALPWEKNAPITYTDTEGNWAAGRIEAAKYLFPDATNLVGTKSFRPTQTITREEAIYALVVAWQYASKVNTCDQSVLNMFDDSQSISVGVRPYLAVAVSEDLVNGIRDTATGKTNIDAQKGLSRAEFATLLARALKHGKGEAATLELKVNTPPDTTNQDSILLTGKVTSNQISDVTLTCNQEKVELSRDGSFSLTLMLKEGANRFELVAANSTGLNKTQVVAVQKETKKAAIRFFTAPPSETTERSVTLGGTVDHFKSDCVLFLDGKKVNVNAEGRFELILKLEEGANRFELILERLGVLETSQTISIKRLTTVGAGEWMEQLPDGVAENNYNIKKKTQYRSKSQRTIEDSATPLPNWDIKNTVTRWGDWSAWSSTPMTGTATLEVNTRQVETPHTKTVYNYDKWSYISTSTGKWQSSYAAYTGPGYQQGSGKWEYLTTDTPLTRSGYYDGQASYVAAGGWRWWHETTSQVAAPSTYATEYQYRSKDVTTYTLTCWSDWTSWGDMAVSSDDTTQVETRTMYQFTPKD